MTHRDWCHIVRALSTYRGHQGQRVPFPCAKSPSLFAEFSVLRGQG